MESYIRLGIVTLLPAILSLCFVFLQKKTKFKDLPYALKQIIFGIAFGGLAVIGTEFGIPLNGAQVNARNSAVVTAGLFFGGPAGIIAGVIGGVERYIAVAWGVGTYTRVACTIATIFAGFYSALLRKIIFVNRRPNAALAFSCGLVMEVIHMTLFFFTNLDDTMHVMEVIKACSVAMIPANAIGAMLPTIPFYMFSSKRGRKYFVHTISQSLQSWLLLVVTIIFAVTTAFMYFLQTGVAEKQTQSYLSLAISDIDETIVKASNDNLLKICHNVANLLDKRPLTEICEELNLTEISIIDETGYIVESTNPVYVGFNMRSGSQSEEFLCLLGDTDEYVQEYQNISINEDVQRKYAGVKIENGFVQVGYDAEHFQEDITNEVIKAASSRHVGTTGFVLVANVDGWIISKPNDVIINSLNEVAYNINVTDGEVYSRNVFGVDYLAVGQNVEGFYILSVMPADEAYHVRDSALYANIFMEVIVFAFLFILVYRLIKRIVVDKMDEVNISLGKITAGDLSEVVNVKNYKEFVKLSSGINSTVDSLKQYIDDVRKRIDAELEYAKNIQSSALPHIFPTDHRFDLFALMEPAREVGGDFYDFSKSGSDYYNFLVADVSGKGIPGAMFMMRAKSVISSLTEVDYPVNEVFTKANETLCSGNDAEMFVTSWMAKVDLNTGIVTYANAGHNPPVLKHADGRCEYIKGKAGFVLGGMDGVNYQLQEIKLEKGDILFLYTDGVVEANNKDQELYGEDRLVKCLESVSSDVAMEILCGEVIGDVGRFVGENEQFDDITVLAFKYLG